MACRPLPEFGSYCGIYTRPRKQVNAPVGIATQAAEPPRAFAVDIL